MKSHDFLHNQFLKAAELRLLPLNKEESNDRDLQVKTS
jgi:hypothetical protein